MKRNTANVLMMMVALGGLFSLSACEEKDWLNVTDSSMKSPLSSPVSKGDCIVFAQDIYTVKVGDSITITPVSVPEGTQSYTWREMDGEDLGHAASLTCCWHQARRIFLELEVLAGDKKVYGEVCVDVLAKTLPQISLPIPDGGFVVAQGQTLRLQPVITHAEGATYEWLVDAQMVCTDSVFTFVNDEAGMYTLQLKVTNADGTSTLSFEVKVVANAADAFSWMFESNVYNVSVGRTLRLLPYHICNGEGATYYWYVDGVEVQRDANPLFVYEASTEGKHPVKVVMQKGSAKVERELTVHVCPPEGTYQRPVLQSSQVACNSVYTYLPAPGQFINDPSFAPASMDEACRMAEERLAKEYYVSLGAFGGYIVVGFDHSIENDGGYNLEVRGNPHDGSSEPGIVYVMQDENGDGLPNDTWYELKGSEYGQPGTIQDYEVTYYRPQSAHSAVSWTDNQGGSGVINYLAQFHNQPYYYPAWKTADTYVLRGTRLEPRCHDEQGIWRNEAYDWGYADNMSAQDMKMQGSSRNANHFRISDAVTFDGRPANLQYIDFVKVQTGVQVQAPMIGENSTEVLSIKDYNLLKVPTSIPQDTPGRG